jgi:hypothetical protein
MSTGHKNVDNFVDVNDPRFDRLWIVEQKFEADRRLKAQKQKNKPRKQKHLRGFSKNRG